MSIEKAMAKHQKKTYSLGMFHPVKTSKIGGNICCIRQKDVNIWLYRKSDVVICFDTGYFQDDAVQQNIQRLGIQPEEIKAVFLTHGDLENAGGLSSEEFFAPTAKIYAHPAEEALIRGKTSRLSSGLFKVASPLSYEGDLEFFQNKESFDFGAVTVQCFYCTGHTQGHSVFLVDRRYLFTGDSVALNDLGGQCYFHEFNENTKENIQSLTNLKENLVGREPETVYSSHNGYCEYEKAFSHISQVAKARKNAPFDPKAPLDVFTENI